VKHQSAVENFVLKVLSCCILFLVCGWFDGEEQLFIRLTFVAVKFYNWPRWAVVLPRQWPWLQWRKGNRIVSICWLSLWIFSECRLLLSNTPCLSCFKEWRDCTLPWGFCSYDGSQHWRTSAPKGGALVPLEMSYKMQLRALLAFYHHDLHKKRGGVNILKSTIQDFKVFRNSECNPVQEIVPWGIDKR